MGRRSRTAAARKSKALLDGAKNSSSKTRSTYSFGTAKKNKVQSLIDQYKSQK